MQAQVGNIRRRSNGTSDADAYCREAFLLRREAANRIFRRLGQLGRLLIGAMVILTIYAVLLPRNLVPPGASSMPVSANIPLQSD
jgi:hypothetical protein